MNILICSPYVIESENDNGTNKITFNLMKNITNHKFDILCPYDENKKTSKLINADTHYLQYHKMEVNKVNRLKSLFTIYTFEEFYLMDLNKKLAKFINENHKRYDVIHIFSYSFMPAINMLDQDVKRKIIFSAIDSKLLHEKSRLVTSSGFKKFIRIIQYIKVYFSCWINYRKLKNIIFVSQLDVDSIKNINSNGLCIPNGVINNNFNYDLESSCRDVVFHGDMTYEPNIRAAKLLSDIFIGNDINQTYKVKIIGKGSEKYSFLDIIQGMGFVDDLYFELSKSFCYISLIDTGAGIKNKILDAFSVGLPVIATMETMKGIPLAISGSDYILVESTQDVINALLVLDKDKILRRNLSVNGKKMITENYSWDSVALSYKRIYSSVVNYEN